jgi:hypothetical protein
MSVPAVECLQIVANTYVSRVISASGPGKGGHATPLSTIIPRDTLEYGSDQWCNPTSSLISSRVGVTIPNDVVGRAVRAQVPEHRANAWRGFSMRGACHRMGSGGEVVKGVFRELTLSMVARTVLRVWTLAELNGDTPVYSNWRCLRDFIRSLCVHTHDRTRWLRGFQGARSSGSRPAVFRSGRWSRQLAARRQGTPAQFSQGTGTISTS